MSVMRKCVCCGKEYDYCPACPKTSQPGWMATFCSEPCKELFNIVSAYNTKRIGKDSVRKFMSEHKIEIDKYLPPVQKVLNEAKESEVKANVPSERRVSSYINTPKTPKEESKSNSSSTLTGTSDYRSRRNKKRKARQLDIDLK